MTILLIDSRYWNGTRLPYGLNAKGFYGKVSEGGYPPDHKMFLWLQHQRRACRFLKLPYGGFHYWRHFRDQIAQVDDFASRLDQPEMPPALDFEDPYSPAHKDSGIRILQFVREAVATLGGRPLVYTRASWWNSRVDTEEATEIASLCDLWVAHYTTLPQPLLPRGWDNWVMWQYAGDQKVSEMNAGVDFNRAKESWAAQYIPA